VTTVAVRADLPRTHNHARVWLVYLLGFLLLFGLARPMANRIASGEHDRSSTGQRVFGTYWASGDAANRGLDPYAVQPPIFRVSIPLMGIRILDRNPNPPLLLPLFQATARLPIATAAYVWTYTAFALFVLSGGILLALHIPMRKCQALWMPLSMPVIGTLGLGQLYARVLLLAVLVWAALRRERITAAAICLDLIVAIKPIFLFWPVLLAVRRERRLAVRSILAALAFSLLPLAICGPTAYVAWVRALGNDRHYLFFTNIALGAVGHRFGHPLIGWVLAALVGAGCVFAARRKVQVHMLSIVGACFCAPLAWSLTLAGK
jgi:hypothetical protein